MPICINTPDVIHESFDDESVIVNLRQGIYFSLNREGLEIWEEISKGTTLERLLALGGESSDAVLNFLHQLNNEHLIVIEGESLPDLPAETPLADTGIPHLQKFEDLQDLLVLDPIHDVDERGWPHAKPSEEKNSDT